MSVLTMIPGGAERLLAVSPYDLIAYLRGNGWREQNRERTRAFWTLEGERGEPCEVLVPTEPTFKDYGVRVSEAIATLEAVEERGRAVILNDIEHFSSDIVRVRLSGSDIERGDVGFEEGVNLFEKARDLMMAAACSALETKAVHPNRKPDRASRYLRNIRLGQTEVGSFVVQIISRVSPELEPGGQIDLIERVDAPFERVVTQTLAQSLNVLTEVVNKGTGAGQFQPFEDAVPLGVSANLCEALAGLQAEDQKVSVALRWAKTRSVDVAVPNNFSFTSSGLSVLGEVAKTLRANAPLEDFFLNGIVVKLAKGPKARRGEVGVLAVVSEQPRIVTVFLEEYEYRQAVQAHRDKDAISCTGNLVKEGRRFVLRAYQRFRVIPKENP